MKKLVTSSLLLLSAVSIFFHTKTNDTGEYLFADAQRNSITLVDCFFTDLCGTLRGVSVPLEHFESALKDGLSFDGSSIPGMRSIDRSDMILVPDIQTFTTTKESAHVLCDVHLDVDQPYEGDPRGILKRLLEQAHGMGYEFLVGPEMEFFVTHIKNNQLSPQHMIDGKGYFEVCDSPAIKQFETRLMATLRGEGIDAEKLHDEVAPSQKEFSIRYNNALKIADDIVCAKKCMERLARSMNLHVSFMPKPLFGKNGSGMHINFSLFDTVNNCNAFYDAQDSYHLSPVGKQFIAGILNRIKELTLLFNPTVNSYKRLVPGYEAPCNIGWGELNRSAVIRLPHIRGICAAKRGELRSPDPSCNPYLAFAALLAAGLEGIKNKEVLSDALSGNIFQLTQQQLAEQCIDFLPSSLEQAVACFEKSTFACSFLGEHVCNQLSALKKKEAQEFQTAVTDWEVERYF